MWSEDEESLNGGFIVATHEDVRDGVKLIAFEAVEHLFVGGIPGAGPIVPGAVREFVIFLGVVEPEAGLGEVAFCLCVPFAADALGEASLLVIVEMVAEFRREEAGILLVDIECGDCAVFGVGVVVIHVIGTLREVQVHAHDGEDGDDDVHNVDILKGYYF